MSTYSTNFGDPSIEATNWNSLLKIMQGLPNNTSQLISPQNVRDAVYTTWEQSIFKVFEIDNKSYIAPGNATQSGTSSHHKILFGKKELGLNNNIMDNTLLSSDTDIFFYNNKSDSNLSLQDTKISFLAGTVSTLFQDAPYLKASKSSNSIDLSIINPSGGGIISIDSDFIELGSGGWNINNGDLYPVVDGSNIGRTGSNRIGTIYMASTIDYLNNLKFKSGTSSIEFDSDGKITTKSLEIEGDFKFGNSSIPGYYLTTDASGNASWTEFSMNTFGITAGYVPVSDGSGSTEWRKRLSDATGVTSGYVLTSNGTSDPEYKAYVGGGEISYNNTAFVDNVNGDNSTAISGRIDKPFKTISSAISSNGFVHIMPGDFDEEVVISDTISIYADMGVRFIDGGFHVDEDGDLTLKGYAKFIGNSYVCKVDRFGKSDMEFDYVDNNNFIFLTEGKLKMKFNWGKSVNYYSHPKWGNISGLCSKDAEVDIAIKEKLDISWPIAIGGISEEDRYTGDFNIKCPIIELIESFSNKMFNIDYIGHDYYNSNIYIEGDLLYNNTFIKNLISIGNSINSDIKVKGNLVGNSGSKGIQATLGSGSSITFEGNIIGMEDPMIFSNGGGEVKINNSYIEGQISLGSGIDMTIYKCSMYTKGDPSSSNIMCTEDNISPSSNIYIYNSSLESGSNSSSSVHTVTGGGYKTKLYVSNTVSNKSLQHHMINEWETSNPLIYDSNFIAPRP